MSSREEKVQGFSKARGRAVLSRVLFERMVVQPRTRGRGEALFFCPPQVYTAKQTPPLCSPAFPGYNDGVEEQDEFLYE